MSKHPGTLERGETATPKGLESLAPQSEKPASHCANNELKGVKDPESVIDVLSSSAEQEFLQEFLAKLADSSIDSDDDVPLKNLPVCANC